MSVCLQLSVNYQYPWHIFPTDIFNQNFSGLGHKNVIIPFCKIHNDSSCSISQDGSLIAVFVPSIHGFPMDAQLKVISLKPENYLQCIYSRKYGKKISCLCLHAPPRKPDRYLEPCQTYMMGVYSEDRERLVVVILAKSFFTCLTGS